MTELKNKCRDGGHTGGETSLNKSVWPSLHRGSTLDGQVKEYIIVLRATAGVVNTAIVLAAAEEIVAAAEEIVAATDHRLVKQHDGSVTLTKSWAKSLLIRMGFVKRKGSTSSKLPVAEFGKRKEQYLSDIHSKVIMNDIPPCLNNQLGSDCHQSCSCHWVDYEQTK